MSYSIPEKLSVGIQCFLEQVCFRKEMATSRWYRFMAWRQKNTPTAEETSRLMEVTNEHEKADANFKTRLFDMSIVELQTILSECRLMGFTHCVGDIQEHLKHRQHQRNLPVYRSRMPSNI